MKGWIQYPSQLSGPLPHVLNNALHLPVDNLPFCAICQASRWSKAYWDKNFPLLRWNDWIFGFGKWQVQPFFSKWQCQQYETCHSSIRLLDRIFLKDTLVRTCFERCTESYPLMTTVLTKSKKIAKFSNKSTLASQKIKEACKIKNLNYRKMLNPPYTHWHGFFQTLQPVL